MHKKAGFSLTGFMIGLIFISCISVVFAMFMGYINEEYPSSDFQNSLSKYNITEGITTEMENIRNNTEISQDKDWLDVIGGYFSAGYSAVKVTTASYDLFGTMMEDSSDGMEFLDAYNLKDFILLIIMVLFFIGIMISVLLKYAV